MYLSDYVEGKQKQVEGRFFPFCLLLDVSATSVVKALTPVSATQIGADKDWELGSVDKLVIECLDCDPLLLAVRL